MSERMKYQTATRKPRVYKVLDVGGMWWADVLPPSGFAHAERFPTHTQAIARACDLARMVENW